MKYEDKKLLLNNLTKEGLYYLEKKNFDLAVKKFEEILLYHPKNSQILNLTAISYHQLANTKKALKYISKAIKHHPSEIGFHINHGNIHKDLKNYVFARKAYKNALAINEASIDVLYNIGVLYTAQHKYTEAKNYYIKVLKIDSFQKYALDNLGNAYFELSEFENAINCYNQAIKIDNNFYQAHYNLSLVLLLKNSYKIGWEKYEFRLKKDDYNNNIPFLNYEYWDGSSLNNKNLLVYCEQGIGDSIQFARYIKKIKKNNTKIILFCNQNIKILFKNILEIDFIITDQKKLQKINYYISLMSLPYIFRNKKLPESYNFFKKNTKKNLYWKSKLINKKKINVGIAWQGSITHVSDYKRSIQLKKFKPLLEIKDIEFISLQKGYGREQIISNRFEKLIIDFSAEINSFQNTLSIIENLDLVISVDTAVAHIAATMDKETWILLPFVPDFRWGLNDTKTDWYKSVRLFRQSNNYQWDSVIKEVKKELKNKYK